MTTARPPIELVSARDTMFITGLAPHLSPETYPPGIEVILAESGGRFSAHLDGFERPFGVAVYAEDAARDLLAQLRLGREVAVVLAAIANPTTERDWKRGDLVLVDGTKEGCVFSVNGTVAQVSMWAAQAAVVNVDRLSPLEVTGERVEHPEERIAGKDIDLRAFKQVVKAITEAAIVPDANGFYTLDAVIDPSPAIRCKPEVGVVLAGPDGPILTVDPLDGGNVWEVNIGDVVAWHERHKAPPSFMERLDMIETLEASVAPIDAEDGSL